MKFRFDLRRSFRFAILWVGVVLCAVAVWRIAPRIEFELRRLHGADIACVAAMAVCAWLLSVAGWRAVVSGYFRRRLSWAESVRQSGLLLVGKYVPGGVFGLVARATQSGKGETFSGHVGAGVYEQAASLWAMAASGAVFFAAAMSHPAFFSTLPAVPFLGFGLAAVSMVAGHRFLPERWKDVALVPVAGRRSLLAAHAMFGVSSIFWIALVSFLVVRVYGLELLPAAGVGGAFALAVTAGMMAVFVPGGILVRESVFAVLASRWLAYDDAVLLAASMRIVTTLIDMLAGFAAMLLPARVRSDVA